MRKLFALLAVFSLFVATFAISAQDDDMMGGDTIADIVVASAEAGEFTTLLAAVQAADPLVLEALSDPEAEFTVFAPTDAAFAALIDALGEEAFGEVLADTELLTEILLYHVVEGAAFSADVVEALEVTDGFFSVPTLQGQYIDISIDEDGVIYVDDAVLVLDMLDIEASNGVIHVIDAVLLPEDRTIAEIVIDAANDEDAPEFTLLLAAVLAADEAVVTALSDPEAELTVFAPTDAAFEALGDTLTAVLEDQELLTTILLYHVTAGVVYSDDLVDLLLDSMMDDDMMADVITIEVEMLDGSIAVISATEEGVFIDGAEIILTDIDAVNGVIHVIDAVIIPGAE